MTMEVFTNASTLLSSPYYPGTTGWNIGSWAEVRKMFAAPGITAEVFGKMFCWPWNLFAGCTPASCYCAGIALYRFLYLSHF